MSGNHISQLVKGKSPTLLTTSKGNEVINALNVLANIEIFPDTSDRVEYSDNGVYIYYKKAGLDISGEFTLLDGNDVTKQWKFVVEDGVITTIEEQDSAYELKDVDLCEGGETSSYQFVIKT